MKKRYVLENLFNFIANKNRNTGASFGFLNGNTYLNDGYINLLDNNAPYDSHKFVIKNLGFNIFFLNYYKNHQPANWMIFHYKRFKFTILIK